MSFSLEPIPVNLPQQIHDVAFPQRQLSVNELQLRSTFLSMA